VVVCAALGALLIGRRSPNPSTPAESPGPRPVATESWGEALSVESAAELFDLPTDVPQTVEALKEEAIQACRCLVADLPERPESHTVMALTYKRFGRTAEAIDCWQKSLQINPSFSPAYFGQAAVAAEKAEYEKAEALLRKAIRLNPQLPGAHNLLTEVLLDQGKAEEALSVALEHRKLFPESHEGRFWLGQAYLQLKDYENARKSHEEVIQLAPDFTLSYHSLALICARLGEREKAKEYRQKFAGLKRTDMERDRGRNKLFRDLPYQRGTAANAHLCAGNVQLRVGSPRKAEAHWVRGVAVAPERTDCREDLAALYEEQGRLHDALRLRQELVALEPDNADYQTAVASLHARLHHFDAAEAAFRQAIETAPQRAEGYLGLVRLYLETDRNLAKAPDLARQAVALEPSARNYVLLGAVLEQVGERGGALAAVERAIELDPEGPAPRQMYELLNRDEK
jgi:tetratricopeptide (TPR) repeat protein